MKIISISIDVTKLDKTRFYVGKKGTYANLTFRLNDEPDQYGNHGFIAEAVSKEERESGMRGTILGNGKVVWEGESQTQAAPAQMPPMETPEFDDPIPF